MFPFSRSFRTLFAAFVMLGMVFGSISMASAAMTVEYLGGNITTCAQIGYSADDGYIDSGKQDTEVDDVLIDPSGKLGNISYTLTLNEEGEYTSLKFTADPGFAVVAVIVKGGNGANIFEYDSAVTSDSGLYAPDNKGISHFSFCYVEVELPPMGEWCSPGFWRQEQHFWAWPEGAMDMTWSQMVAAQGTGQVLYYKDPTVTKGNPWKEADQGTSILEVVQNPQKYGGEATNAVADYLSGLEEVGLNYLGTRVEDSCPLGNDPGTE